MKKVLFIVLGILLMVCGVFMMFNPLAVFSTLGYLMGFGILLIIYAAMSFCNPLHWPSALILVSIC